MPLEWTTDFHGHLEKQRPLCLGLTDFLGHRTLTVQSGTVLGKVCWRVPYAAARHFGDPARAGQKSYHQISLVALMHLTLWNAEDGYRWGLLPREPDRAWQAGPPAPALCCRLFLFWAKFGWGLSPPCPDLPHRCHALVWELPMGLVWTCSGGGWRKQRRHALPWANVSCPQALESLLLLKSHWVSSEVGEGPPEKGEEEDGWQAGGGHRKVGVQEMHALPSLLPWVHRGCRLSVPRTERKEEGWPSGLWKVWSLERGH